MLIHGTLLANNNEEVPLLVLGFSFVILWGLERESFFLLWDDYILIHLISILIYLRKHRQCNNVIFSSDFCKISLVSSILPDITS